MPLLLAAVSLRCSGDKLVLPDEGDPAKVVMVSGNNQNGTVGLLLPDSVIVQVTDTKNRPVVGARVLFVLQTNAAGANLIPDTVTTDADGRARSRWILGTKSGLQTAEARVIGFSQVKTTITATATADAPDTVFAVRGDSQSATINAALPESLVVRVNDQFGNPVAGLQVDWSVSGGGTVSPVTVNTGVNGEAATQRTLGSTSGQKSASATVSGVNGSPVTFVHTANAGGPVGLLKIAGDGNSAPAGTFLAESVKVQLVDAANNGVAGRQVAFAPSPGSGSAAPTSVTTDFNGFAAARWTLGPVAGPQSMIVSSAGIPVTFNATATNDVPTQMAITAGNGQTTVAGTAVPVDPAVRVRDALNNPVANVSVTFTVTNGGGTVSGPSGSGASTVVATNASGIATLTSWTLGAIAGSNSMSATASGPGGPLTGSPLLFTATGTAGTASQVTIIAQPPASVASGATFGTTPVVQLQDAGGNPVSTSGVNVTVSISSGSGTLNGTKTQPTNSSGQASFPGLSISGLAGQFTLDFDSGSLTGDTSTPITLTAGAASKLFLTTQPSGSAQSGVAFAQQPVVQVQDGAGNPVSQSGILVTASIATGGGTLQGTTTATTSSSGVATFTDLAISGAAGGRTLDFTTTGLTKATSNTITIGAGGATKLGFGGQPTNSAAGAAISPAVTVLVQDASGNTVAGANNAVTIALLANPGGSTLSGTLTVNAVNGVATFSDLSLDKVGTGYTLNATATGLTGATSNGFNITAGTATQLVFTQQPSNVVAGANIAPAVTVTAKDGQGNTVTSYSTAIGLTLGNNPGNGTLSGGGAVTPVSGVATFAGLHIDKTGNNYTLVANSGTLNQISSGFNVTPGAASQLVFTTQPSNSVTGPPAVIAPPVKVEVQDAQGNTLTSATTSITVAIGTNPPGNGVLAGTKTVNAVAGVATFSNLSIDKPGNGYTLTADGGGLPTETSATFNISVGTGNKLAFIVQPSDAVVGQSVSPAVQVEIQDAQGNPVGGNNQITLVSSGPAISGAVVNASNGIATFANLKVNAAAPGVTLTALASGLNSATSASFDVSAAATSITINSDLPDPSRVGQNVTVTWTVSVVAPGSGTPTGTVTVTDGTASCQQNVAGGQCILVSTTAGSKTITATYSGDGNFNGSTSAGTSHLVNPANTTTSITPETPDPSVVGQPVTVVFSVTVNAPGNGTPTGNVTVSAGADNCSAPVSAGQCDISFTSPGAKTINASYPGDGNFNASSDNEPHTVNKSGTTTTITSDSPDPSGVGAAVTVGWTVVPSGAGGGTPTGTVTVTVSGSGDTCNAPVATGSCQLTISTVGSSKTITASYGGDANFNSSNDTEQHDVSAGSTTTTITSTAPSSSVTGQPVAIHYSVTPSGGGTPTGTVTVSDGTQSCNASVAAGQCNITFNGAGSRTLVASYLGDANFSGSTSPGFGHQVNTASTTTTITSDNPDPSSAGTPVTVQYSVTVDAPGSGTPTGNVTVTDGTDSCVGTVAAGQCDVTFGAAGPRNITANYAGDADFTGSVSAPEPHNVNTPITTTTITGHTPAPSVRGQQISVSVSVSSVGGTPTGSVTVGDGSVSCNATLSGGSGSCNLTLTTAGARTLVATYGGAPGFSGSTSAGVSHTVDPFGPADPASSTANVPAGTSGAQTTITVQAVDQFGNQVGSGGETVVVTVSGANSAGPITATDNGDGTYTAVYTPTVSGPDQVDITMNGTPISGSPFNSAVAVGSATQVQIFAGNNQTGPAGGQLPVNPSVLVRDSHNNPVAGVLVTFSVGSGGGSVTSGSATSNSSGVAGVGWTLGPTAGSNTLTATKTGLTGSPVLFSATGTAGPATRLAFIVQPGNDVVGASLSPAIEVELQDAAGNRVVSATDPVTLALGNNPGGATLAGAGPVIAVNGVATFSGVQVDQAANGYNLVASAAGLAGATSHNFDIAKASTTLTMTSDNPDPSVVGELVTVAWSLAVTAPGSGVPTGTVTVSDGPVNCQASVAAGSCQLALTSVGNRNLAAAYAGDANFKSSNAPSISHTVNQANTSTAIASDTPDPSGAGQAVTVDFAVSVTAPGAGTPTGNVTVSDGVASCTASVAAGSCNLTLLVPGTQTLVATYAGDPKFNGSSSPGEPHSVGLASTTTAITNHKPDPSDVGEPVKVDFDVIGGLTPTGSVTVSDGVVSCTGAVAAGGKGNCTLAMTSAGSHTLVATYSGDGVNGGSTSPGVAHTVNQSATTATITSDTPDPSVANQAFTVAFTVIARSPGSGTPTGNVTITVNDGSGASCSASVAAGSCQLTLTAPGAKVLTATYAGDADFLPDTDTENHVVDPFGSLDPASSTATVPDGQAGQVTTIVIHARDQFGNPIPTGGAGVTVTISGANSDTAVVTDNGDGTYTATYTPANAGTDTVDITINGTPIQNSPFTSTVS